jgi:hypothetical protein
METGRVRRIIFSRFTLLSLGCIGALALVMSFVLSSLLTRAASEWEWENTAALVRREVQMAGLEDSEIADGHEGVSDATVLQKPFTPDILASRVRETIQAVSVAG